MNELSNLPIPVKIRTPLLFATVFELTNYFSLMGALAQNSLGTGDWPIYSKKSKGADLCLKLTVFYAGLDTVLGTPNGYHN